MKKLFKKGLRITNEIWDMDELETIEKCLYTIYYQYPKENDEDCTFTNKTLAEFLKVSEHSIQRYKAHLKLLGLIEVDGVKTKNIK